MMNNEDGFSITYQEIIRQQSGWFTTPAAQFVLTTNYRLG
jgi:hypothetical protein